MGGQTGGAIGLSLTFLVLFVSRQKEQKEKIIKEKEKGKLIFITSHLLSELDDLITEIIFMQDGEVHFHKKVDDLKAETNETKISKAIASILKQKQPETQNPKLETAS